MSTESTHLGTKIQQEMERLGMLKKDLAAHFNMKPPSVTELLQTGRLAKDKYQRLVDLNGRSLDWWFDVETPDHPASATSSQRKKNFAGHGSGDLVACETLGTYSQHSSDMEFELITLFNSLPRSEQARIMDEIRQKATFYRAALEDLLSRQRKVANH